ncbi:hypothetical protein CWS02_15495 [Enterobacter sp. EA-1]|nr:hypothetical protein CWS02_15495 [Enterobacter sp. EA-1]
MNSEARNEKGHPVKVACEKRITGYMHRYGVWLQPIHQEILYATTQRLKNNRNYLIKCTCPHCSKQSEHSFTRVQKGSALMCPHCSKIFNQDRAAIA